MEKVEVVSKAVKGSATERSRSGDIMSPIARTTKRFLDVVASIVGLAVFSPVLLVIYIAIKCEDHGKAIFSQERVGYHGEIFTLYKFRSMITLAANPPCVRKGINGLPMWVVFCVNITWMNCHNCGTYSKER